MAIATRMTQKTGVTKYYEVRKRIEEQAVPEVRKKICWGMSGRREEERAKFRDLVLRVCYICLQIAAIRCGQTFAVRTLSDCDRC
jgi:hypothetical protein